VEHRHDEYELKLEALRLAEQRKLEEQAALEARLDALRSLVQVPGAMYTQCYTCQTAYQGERRGRSRATCQPYGGVQGSHGLIICMKCSDTLYI
jgi:hypothetical protein